MKKLLTSAIFALALTACSSTATSPAHKLTLKSSPSPVPVSSVSSKCADMLAHEIGTNSGMGAYDCLSDDIKFQLWFKDGVTNDAQLVDLLADSATYDVASRPVSVPNIKDADPHKFAYHLYPTKYAGTPQYIQLGKALLIVEDTDGKVSTVEFV